MTSDLQHEQSEWSKCMLFAPSLLQILENKLVFSYGNIIIGTLPLYHNIRVIMMKNIKCIEKAKNCINPFHHNFMTKTSKLSSNAPFNFPSSQPHSNIFILFIPHESSHYPSFFLSSRKCPRTVMLTIFSTFKKY